MTHPIFVFGSNLAGRHGKGAALWARQHRGAIYGQGVGPQGDAHTGSTTTYNAKTGQTHTWNGGQPVNNDHFADSNGNVLRSDGSGGWQQHSAGGWGAASGDTSWADRDAQGRAAGDDRFGSFGGGDRFGGGGFGGGRFGGGGFRGGFGGRR